MDKPIQMPLHEGTGKHFATYRIGCMNTHQEKLTTQFKGNAFNNPLVIITNIPQSLVYLHPINMYHTIQVVGIGQNPFLTYYIYSTIYILYTKIAP